MTSPVRSKDMRKRGAPGHPCQRERPASGRPSPVEAGRCASGPPVGAGDGERAAKGVDMDNTTTTTRQAHRALVVALVVLVATACAPAPAVPGAVPGATTTIAPNTTLPAPRHVTVTLAAQLVRVDTRTKVVGTVTASHPSGQVRTSWSVTDLAGRSVTGTGPIDVVVGAGVHRVYAWAQAVDGGSGSAHEEFVVVPSDVELRAWEDELLSRVNQARAGAGVVQLTRDDSLAAGARAWSGEMHESGFRHDVGFLAPAAGGRAVSEVIHTGAVLPDAIVSTAFGSWRNSPGHWAVLMGERYRTGGFGISVRIAPVGGTYSVQVMATGRVAAST